MKVRRVFLLGAGASKSWGLPLTNELFPLALTGVPKRQYRQLIRKFIQYQYPHFRRRWKNYPPFEEFLSLVDVYLDFADVIKRGHSFSIEEVTRILAAKAPRTLTTGGIPYFLRRFYRV